MRILFFGDVVGKSGRKKLLDEAPGIAKELKADFMLANAENSAHGFGITPEVAEKFFEAGFDALSLGDHAWDQAAIREYIRDEARLLRPFNWLKIADGAGIGEYEAKDGRRIVVIDLLGTIFMRDGIDNPFIAADEILSKYRLGENADAIFIDFHAEATSEKMSLAHYLDGRVSAVVGTHTHVPTNDAHVMPAGTAYMTDAGMCGDFNSSIGMKSEVSIGRFLGHDDGEKLFPAEGEATLCGCIVEVGDRGLARSVEPVIRGGALKK